MCKEPFAARAATVRRQDGQGQAHTHDHTQLSMCTALHALDTELTADVVAFCPLPEWRHLLVCGCYQLIKSEPPERVGRLLLFENRQPWEMAHASQALSSASHCGKNPEVARSTTGAAAGAAPRSSVAISAMLGFRPMQMRGVGGAGRARHRAKSAVRSAQPKQ